MSNYWEKRKIKEEEKEIYELGLVEVARHEKIFNEALENINDVIQKYVHRYNLLNTKELRTKDLLYGKDLENLTIDLKKYIELSKVISGAEPSEKIMAIDRALKRASLSHRINKMQGIKIRIESELELMNQARNESLSEHLTKVYNTTSQYDNIPLRYDVLKNTFNQRWVGNKNFSERIWKSTENLENNISNMLQRLNVGALYPESIYAELTSKFNVEKWKAKRLVLTETSHIMNKTRQDNYKLMGIEEVEIIATLDFKTSDICQEKDGQVVKLSTAIIGIDLPPFHPNCRTVFAPKSDKKIGERAYRDSETGKTKYTTAKTYKEWVKEIGEPRWQIERKKHFNMARDKKQYEAYKQFYTGTDIIPKKVDSFQEMKYNDVVKWKKIKNDKLKILSTDFGKLETVVRKNLDRHLTKHAIERLDNRLLKEATGEKMNRVMVLHTLRYPLHREVVKFNKDSLGIYRPGYKLIGKYVTIVINPLEETVITVMPTKSKNRRKYGKQT